MDFCQSINKYIFQSNSNSLNEDRLTVSSTDFITDAKLSETDNRIEAIISYVLCAAVLLSLLAGIYIDHKLSKPLKPTTRI